MDTHGLTEPFRLNKQQRFRKQKFMLGGLSVAALNKFFTGSNFEFEWIEVSQSHHFIYVSNFPLLWLSFIFLANGDA